MLVIVVAAIAVLAAVAMLGLDLWRRPHISAPKIVLLTEYPGGESDPSFSPDGNFPERYLTLAARKSGVSVAIGTAE